MTFEPVTQVVTADDNKKEVAKNIISAILGAFTDRPKEHKMVSSTGVRKAKLSWSLKRCSTCDK